jgi:hypothetical protein
MTIIASVHTVDDDFGDEDAGYGSGIGDKIDGGLQGGQPPAHIRAPAGEQRALTQRPVQRPQQRTRRQNLPHVHDQYLSAFFSA